MLNFTKSAMMGECRGGRKDVKWRRWVYRMKSVVDKRMGMGESGERPERRMSHTR